MSIKVVVCENYEDMSFRAAKMFEAQIKEKPNSVLGLATGSTPIGTYRNLIEMHKKGLDFSCVCSYNLDEYYPLSPDNEQSYRYFMDKQLFEHINIMRENTHVPSGIAEDPVSECDRYDDAIEKAGGIDLQLLGIGINGHIGFNEPDEALTAATHLTDLTESTVNANARFFASKEEVPTKAITMGVGSILRAKKIILLASGKNKHEAIKTLLSGKVTTACPATVLNLHANTVLLCDKEAYNG